MAQWAVLPWDERLYADADETILSKANADVENAFANLAGGFSRFPGIKHFVDLPGQRVYLFAYRGNLIAATDRAQVWQVGADASVKNLTGVPLNGGKRVIFAETDDMLTMAAGGPILKLARDKTERLGGNPPNATTHVVYIDGYLMAIERNTGHFTFSNPGAVETWDPLSVFSADAKPDNLTAAVVTPFREILMAGQQSIEQYEALPNGTQPFSRRWATGGGLQFPYTLVATQSGTYGMNDRYEFARFYGQVAQDQGTDVKLIFETIDDWTEAWAGEIAIAKGQEFIVLQAPFATNKHGTKGVTLLLDYRAKKWSFLYGWDAKGSVPTRLPIWSIVRLGNRTYVGVDGGIGILDNDTYQVLGRTQRFLIRSGHIDKFGPSRFDDIRVRMRRGDGPVEGQNPRVGLRVNRDNLGFDQWQFEPLGLSGQREMTVRFGPQGYADTWQFELQVTDDVPVEFVKMEAFVERARW